MLNVHGFVMTPYLRIRTWVPKENWTRWQKNTFGRAIARRQWKRESWELYSEQEQHSHCLTTRAYFLWVSTKHPTEHFSYQRARLLTCNCGEYCTVCASLKRNVSHLHGVVRPIRKLSKTWTEERDASHDLGERKISLDIRPIDFLQCKNTSSLKSVIFTSPWIDQPPSI